MPRFLCYALHIKRRRTFKRRRTVTEVFRSDTLSGALYTPRAAGDAGMTRFNVVTPSDLHQREIIISAGTMS